MNKLTTATGVPEIDKQNTQTADHRDHHIDEDYYSQPGNLLLLLSTGKQQLLFDDSAGFFSGAAPKIQQSHLSNCSKLDPAYGAGVAAAVVVPADQADERSR